MPQKKLVTVYNDSDTRNKILVTATELFALKGFKSVTLKEIAKAVGIKIASIYYYYKDKDALIEDVLARFSYVYKEYHDWLSAMNQKAETLEEVIDNLFNQDFLNKLNPVVCLGMSMALKEQHSHKSAYEVIFKHIYEEGIRNVQAGFDNLIEKKIIPPSDTKSLATLFFFCVMAGNDVRMYDFIDAEIPIDFMNTYLGLRKLMIAALAQGILPESE